MLLVPGRSGCSVLLCSSASLESVLGWPAPFEALLNFPLLLAPSLPGSLSNKACLTHLSATWVSFCPPQVAVAGARTMVLALVAGAVPLMHPQYCCTPDTLSGIPRFRWVGQAPGSTVVQWVLRLILGGSQHLERHVAVSSCCFASENLIQREQAALSLVGMDLMHAGAVDGQGVHRSLLDPPVEHILDTHAHTHIRSDILSLDMGRKTFCFCYVCLNIEKIIINIKAKTKNQMLYFWISVELH